MKVIIELDFEESPSQIQCREALTDVQNYLKDLMYNKINLLDWHTGAVEYYYIKQIKEVQKKTFDKG